MPNESRIAELEFSFPVNSLTTAKLAKVFALEKMPLQIGRLQFQPVNGFMNGFIDLTFEHGGRFYFADWKSNWLGPTTRAYRPGQRSPPRWTATFTRFNFASTAWPCIATCGCAKADYDFDRHFGGAFYVFLRGIDPAEPGNGVHFQR